MSMFCELSLFLPGLKMWMADLRAATPRLILSSDLGRHDGDGMSVLRLMGLWDRDGALRSTE